VHRRLTNLEIILEEFQPNLCDHNTSTSRRQMDKQLAVATLHSLRLQGDFLTHTVHVQD